MSRRSLPELHSRVTANASQFVSELQRADNVSRRSVASIDREMNKLERSVGRKFSLAGIGTSFLGGLGIGSGFALASTVVGAITNHFREQEQHLKNMDAIWERMQKRSLEFSRTLMTPGEKLASLNNEMDELQKKYIALAQPKTQQIFVGGQHGGQWITQEIPKTREETEALAALVEQMQELGVERAKFEKDSLSDAEKQLARDFEELTKQMREEVKLRQKRNEDNEKEIAQLEKLADRYRDMLDPLSVYRNQIADVQMLFQLGLIPSVEEADAVILELETSMVEASGALERFFGELDKKSTTMVTGTKEKVSAFSAEMAQMWNNVSDRAGQAFADMVLTGENAFKKLPDMFSRAVLEIVARMAILNPLLNMMFGGTSGWSALPSFFGGAAGAGGGKARGGAAEAGVMYRVNEEGQEFFKSNVGGTIMPVGATRGLAGVGGVTYAPVINVAAGITRDELLPALMPILRQHGRGVISAIAEAQRRGRPVAAASL